MRTSAGSPTGQNRAGSLAGGPAWSLGEQATWKSGPGPGEKRAPFPSSWQPHRHQARPCRCPGTWRKSSEVSSHLRVSGEAEGCRENPDPTESGTAPQPLPTTSCEHLPLSCCSSRICFSERRGEYSRTIKYSFCGSCSIYMPMFIQQTFSEGLLGARCWRTSASATAR